jgi:hypothetical protein
VAQHLGAERYAGFSAEGKGDFIIDMMLPWYVSFFSTWLDYSDADAVCFFWITTNSAPPRPQVLNVC